MAMNNPRSYWHIEQPALAAGVVLAFALLSGCNPEIPTDPSPDAGTGPVADAGIGQSCSDASRCNTPPGQCYAAQGSCVNGVCKYPPKETGTACNEATPPSQCFSFSGICQSGQCVASAKPRGATCDDENSCTSKDICDGAGSCAGTPLACNNPPSQCYEPVGACSNGTCSYKLKSAGASCDDGNPCTINDQCNSVAVCSGSPQSCNSPPEQCYESTGTCNPKTGMCTYALAASGTSCQLSNMCAVAACNSSGQCVATGSITCYDTPCATTMGCDPSTGCIYDDWCSRSGRSCYDGCCRDDLGRCVY